MAGDMAEVKINPEVSNTTNGDLEKQRQNCANYIAIEYNSGICFSDNVVETGNCIYFKAKI